MTIKINPIYGTIILLTIAGAIYFITEKIKSTHSRNNTVLNQNLDTLASANTPYFTVSPSPTVTPIRDILGRSELKGEFPISSWQTLKLGKTGLQINLPRSFGMVGRQNNDLTPRCPDEFLTPEQTKECQEDMKNSGLIAQGIFDDVQGLVPGSTSTTFSLYVYNKKIHQSYINTLKNEGEYATDYLRVNCAQINLDNKITGKGCANDYQSILTIPGNFFLETEEHIIEFVQPEIYVEPMIEQSKLMNTIISTLRSD